jgi:hypothetical protein
LKPSFVPNLLGRLITPEEVVPYFAAITSAIEQWEPRFRVTSAAGNNTNTATANFSTPGAVNDFALMLGSKPMASVGAFDGFNTDLDNKNTSFVGVSYNGGGCGGGFIGPNITYETNVYSRSASITNSSRDETLPGPGAATRPHPDIFRRLALTTAACRCSRRATEYAARPAGGIARPGRA